MSENQRSSAYLDRLSVQIARVVMAAGFYEDDLTIAIGSALRLTALQCNALVRPLGTRAKLDLCERLVSGGDDSAKAWVKKHTRRARKLFDQRNAIIHGVFGHDDDDRVTVRSYGGKHKLSGIRERWDGSRISDVATCLMTMRDQIDDLALHIASALQGDQTQDH